MRWSWRCTWGGLFGQIEITVCIDKLHRQVCNSVEGLVLLSRKMSTENVPANQKAATCPDQSLHAWSVPQLGFYKLNVDAGFDKETGIAKCGMVVRDYTVQVIVSTFTFFQGFHSAP
ncbi:hypothetical protein PTKIN_Ptkin15bG0036800 [Pterospermum kingtungense]